MCRPAPGCYSERTSVWKIEAVGGVVTDEMLVSLHSLDLDFGGTVSLLTRQPSKAGGLVKVPMAKPVKSGSFRTVRFSIATWKIHKMTIEIDGEEKKMSWVSSERWEEWGGDQGNWATWRYYNPWCRLFDFDFPYRFIVNEMLCHGHNQKKAAAECRPGRTSRVQKILCIPCQENVYRWFITWFLENGHRLTVDYTV